MASLRHAGHGVTIRQPTLEDSASLHDLVRRIPPLAENSVYCNLLHCTHFAETCAVAETQGELVAFVTGYLHPKQPDTYFLWQIGVHEHGRGQKLPVRMIQHILARPVCHYVATLEATVSTTNSASRAMFESLARAEGAHLDRYRGYYPPEVFGADNTLAEDLLRIHPLSTPALAR
ncbi:diaminobutyrate acetyltransferase [Halomonas sp. McH1-25]|uniref:diaminobutyrate acetyltransferase n=1 Tax=unclassified Halomonas TaxID=2609666 RepID=UPI001EF43C78|nr:MULTISPECIES: diaminobutyrate acetyltransferase [unclassified Halomonas]MCG7601217.1 diaminobutyrate acetyltransferase [Halomonas sp. McH1-25]MCP1341907.1 diaminobutyrate acetyltransferase [Halomonas sp. FL8]MCP1360172.1 diaminobutyrate acetyltransferase [Halomonas sp. BBD45]